MARIAVCGLGTIGRQVARLLIEHRRDVELVGAASKDPEQIGRPLHEALGLDGGDGPVVADSIGAADRGGSPTRSSSPPGRSCPTSTTTSSRVRARG